MYLVTDMGMVADIQRASVHDGPGIRTTVFLKGCPLNCAWCHNPECISPEPQEMFYPEKCIGCGHCAEGCFCGARVICGREMSVTEVLEKILCDAPYYGDKGGVTVSGGEPLFQAAFTAEILKECKRNRINTAIETSLYKYDKAVFGYCDLILADLKLWSDEIHKKYTGISNKEIIKNFKMLDKSGIPYRVRTPVIPGVTDIENIKKFVATLENVGGHDLLPYHPLGTEKARALGIEQKRFDL